MGRSAVCKDSLLFRVVLCRAGSGDLNPLDENKLVLKQLPPPPPPVTHCSSPVPGLSSVSRL